MHRFKALNDVDEGEDGESGTESKAVTQQVQEATVLKQYNEALKAQATGNQDEAVRLCKELLENPFLVSAEPVKNSDQLLPNGLSPIYGNTALNIKYACLKNLADIHKGQKKLDEALKYYTEALELDGTDVSVWYKAGLVASKLGDIYFAPKAFLRGIACSSQHWPCLDRAAVALFVEGDFTLVMEVLSLCFKLDRNYQRGLALRDIMLESQPWLKTDMNILCPGIELYFDTPYEGPEEVKTKLLQEIQTLRNNHWLMQKRESEKPIVYVQMTKPLNELSWNALGENLVLLKNWFVEKDESAFTRLIETKTALESVTAKTASSEVIVNGEDAMEVTTDLQENQNELEVASTAKENTDDRKGKRRSGSALMEELLWGGKRRSARVRSSRKEQESMSVADALTNILPRKLLHKIKAPPRIDPKLLDDNSMDTMDLLRLFEDPDVGEEGSTKPSCPKTVFHDDRHKMMKEEGYFGTLQEENDVRSFLESHDKQSFVQIIRAYTFTLDKMWNKAWPKKLVTTYINAYKAFRYYQGDQPQFMDCQEIRDWVYEEAGATQLYHELIIDTVETCGENVLPLADMQNVYGISGCPKEFPDALSHAIFELRVMWARAHLLLSRGDTSDAITFLHFALECYENHPELEGHVVHLKNCSKNNRISKEIVQAALDSQSRRKSLAEVLLLFEQGSYKEVVDILKEYLTASAGSMKGLNPEEELFDRKSQLNMLINSLYHLDEYKQCVYWLETSCHELMENLNNSEDSEDQEWKIMFDQILVAIEECCDLGEFRIIDALARPRLSRFVQALCHAICKQIEDSERPPCASRPWILLNRILVAFEETDVESLGKKQSNGEGKDPDEEEDDDMDIPPSVLILFTAHEYLGRREWCNCDGNVLLFLILDQVVPRLRDPLWLAFRETIQNYLDQVVFCLYGHPSKRTKSKFVTDHNVTPIPLTWDRAMQLFQLYRPDELPCFDSARNFLITADTESLFRKIAALIPDHLDPAPTCDQLVEFICDNRKELPEAVKLPLEVTDLFYIIGDYHVKNYEKEKAVTYLLIDLCANPNRVDAWASLALSKASILETLLNSCDIIKIDHFLKEAMAVVRCYDYCLNMDSTLCTLWIEYGTFCYTVHSFCSQRMKLDSDSLSLEQFEQMENLKTKMLETAKAAFKNSDNIWNTLEDAEKQDERWLHYYMLGKICEKYNDMSFIEHYQKAAVLLYENNAQYPRKISYNTPQTLAIEALEVYYRAHVCVIKCLELNNGEPLDEGTRTKYLKFLEVFQKSGFVSQMSKNDLIKQKQREEEEKEQALIKEQTIIKNIVRGMIKQIEKDENAESAEKALIVKELVDEIVAGINYDEVLKQEDTECQVVEEEEPKSEVVDLIEENILEKAKSPVMEVDEKVEENLEDVKVKESMEIDVIDLADDDDDMGTDLLRLAEKAEKDHIAAGGTIVQIPKDVQKENELVYHETYEDKEMDFQVYVPFEPYPHEQVPDDNYYYTLDDLKQTKPSKEKPIQSRKRNHSKVDNSSDSSDSEQITYADESSSSSTSSTSSSSTSEESAKDSDPKERKGGARPCRPPKIPVLKPDECSQGTESNNSQVADKSVSEVDGAELSKEAKEEASLLNQCLSAFETCALRFPQHYKSLYRLAHFFYRSQKHKDLNKCRELLLAQYGTPNGNISGLFSERKNTNFFNGIWRLPLGDVDRAGSFASHMSRSVMLLLEVLRDLRDHKLLLELCLQLRKVPEPDKRYLREDERVQYSKQAMTLSLQTLRTTVREAEVMTLPIVLDAYRIYRRVQKHYPSKETVFGDCLHDAFNRLGKGKTTFEHCLKFCQAELTGNKMAFPSSASSPDTSKVRKVRKDKNVPRKKKFEIPQTEADVAKKTKPEEPPRTQSQAVPEDIPKKVQVSQMEVSVQPVELPKVEHPSVISFAAKRNEAEKDMVTKPSDEPKVIELALAADEKKTQKGEDVLKVSTEAKVDSQPILKLDETVKLPNEPKQSIPEVKLKKTLEVQKLVPEAKKPTHERGEDTQKLFNELKKSVSECYAPFSEKMLSEANRLIAETSKQKFLPQESQKPRHTSSNPRVDVSKNIFEPKKTTPQSAEAQKSVPLPYNHPKREEVKKAKIGQLYQNPNSEGVKKPVASGSSKASAIDNIFSPENELLRQVMAGMLDPGKRNTPAAASSSFSPNMAMNMFTNPSFFGPAMNMESTLMNHYKLAMENFLTKYNNPFAADASAKSRKPRQSSSTSSSIPPTLPSAPSLKKPIPSKPPTAHQINKSPPFLPKPTSHPIPKLPDPFSKPVITPPRSQPPQIPQPPPRPVVDSRPKFNIEALLGKNPGLTITPPAGPSSSQSEAINLSPNRKSSDSLKRGPSSDVTPPAKKKSQSPDIVIID